MSYSFGLRAASLVGLFAAATAKMGEVVAQQPPHKADEEVALKTLQLHAELVGEPPEGKVLSVSMNGYCSVRMGPDNEVAELLHTSTTVSVGLADKAEGE